MLVIGIKNVEELVFFNNELRKNLPEFQKLFQQWAIGKYKPNLRFLSNKSLMAFLEKLENKHIKILEDHFGTQVKINKIDYHIVRHIKSKTTELENTLCNMEGFTNNFCVSRGKDQVYLSFWR